MGHGWGEGEDGVSWEDRVRGEVDVRVEHLVNGVRGEDGVRGRME